MKHLPLLLAFLLCAVTMTVNAQEELIEVSTTIIRTDVEPSKIYTDTLRVKDSKDFKLELETYLGWFPNGVYRVSTTNTDFIRPSYYYVKDGVVSLK